VKTALAALLLWTLCTSVATAHELSREELSTVKFDQRTGSSVPLDAHFRDENGAVVSLQSYFGPRPVILTLNYFHCQNLCPIELDGLLRSLNGLPFTLGQEFTLLSVSIDSREGPGDVYDARSRALRGYEKPVGADAWHVLTGNQDSIDALTHAVGFNYVYDVQEDDFAHPAGVVVLTPKGEVGRYLYGLDFSANDLRLALVDASAERMGSIVDRALLICYHYDPLTGRYTPLALNLVRYGAALGALGVVALVVVLVRSERQKARRSA